MKRCIRRYDDGAPIIEVVECHYMNICLYTSRIYQSNEKYFSREKLNWVEKKNQKKRFGEMYANHNATDSLVIWWIWSNYSYVRVPFTKILMQKFENNNNNWFVSRTFTISQSCMISIEKVLFQFIYSFPLQQPHNFPSEKLIYVAKKKKNRKVFRYFFSFLIFY